MNEKTEKLVSDCFKIFTVLDRLDELDDSDYDIDNSSRTSERENRESLEVVIESKEPDDNVRKCCDNWHPTRGLIDGQNPLEALSDEQFIRTYRFSKECVNDILQTISYGLTKFTNRGQPFAPVLQLLITLKFLTTGT